MNPKPAGTTGKSANIIKAHRIKEKLNHIPLHFQNNARSFVILHIARFNIHAANLHNTIIPFDGGGGRGRGVTLNLKCYFTFSDRVTGEECLLLLFGLVGNFSTPSNVDGEDIS